ncbi:glycosyltransferase [uncultured Maritimibacter sp.]|jgi:hypothetical protein|uniref:glycosyltransferase n=1 Tax=uncultured Maritimibacter sp. TaxID=991866 RepID=UPI0026054A94|nr:glycosyltransferase [uncultured Maritimibacter sp.]
MHIVFETRFSFFGQSGWQSQAAADPALLFDEARLEQRLRYFREITLASLAAQTDPNFQHLILSSTLMPEPWKVKLREVCFDTLGEKRVGLIFKPEGSAGHIIRDLIARKFAGHNVAQVVLDDDDAVSCDFVAALRRYADFTVDDPVNPKPYTFISFPRGYTLGIENGKPAWLSNRFVPYTNLGLALVAPADTHRNPFLTSHKKIGQRHPSLMVTPLRPFYLRAVHEHNDSRAHKSDEILTPAQIAETFDYFPFLAAHFPKAGKRNKAAAE